MIDASTPRSNGVVYLLLAMQMRNANFNLLNEVLLLISCLALHTSRLLSRRAAEILYSDSGMRFMIFRKLHIDFAAPVLYLFSALSLIFDEYSLSARADPDASDAAAAPASSPVATETVPALDPALLLAKSYFDAKEYRRCAHVLRGAAAESPRPSWHAVFLRGYALFMAGEKQKEEEIFEAKGVLRCVWGQRFQSGCTRMFAFNTPSSPWHHECFCFLFAPLFLPLVPPPRASRLDRSVARCRWRSLSRRGRHLAARHCDECRRLRYVLDEAIIASSTASISIMHAYSSKTK